MNPTDLSSYGGRLRDIGYAGQVADFNPATIDSKSNEAAGVIDFGVAVARGASDNTCKAITLDADKILGISVRHPIMPYAADGSVGYSRYDSVPIMKTGFIYAIPYQNVVRGDGVLSVTAQSGKLSGTTAGAPGTGRVAVPGATWETTTTAGQIGLIRINS